MFHKQIDNLTIIEIFETQRSKEQRYLPFYLSENISCLERFSPKAWFALLIYILDIFLKINMKLKISENPEVGIRMGWKLSKLISLFFTVFLIFWYVSHTSLKKTRMNYFFLTLEWMIVSASTRSIAIGNI